MKLKNQGDMKNLRLFVVGESSGDPRRWATLGSRAFVLANDAKEAISIAGSIYGPNVVELDIKEPMVLFVEEDNGLDE
jgi:hypothetical protein